MNLDIEPAGALVTAGLAASEIEGDSAVHGAHAHPAPCANCQAPLAGQFCHACGQRAHLHRSLLHLGEELLHGILHFDAKAWRTLPMLVARPGQLTRRYVDGQRTRFVSPLALFLFMIFFMFFVVSWVSQDSGGAASADTHKAMSKVRSKLDKALAKSVSRLANAEVKLAMAKANDKDLSEPRSELDAAHKDVAGAKEALKVIDAAAPGVAPQPAADPAAAAPAPAASKHDWSNVDLQTGLPALDEALRHAQANPELTLYKLKNSASKYSFLLVPISLPFLWLMFFWRRGITMYDHAVFVLYSLSFMALLVVAMALASMASMKGTGEALLVFLPPVHMFMQLRGTYGLGVMSALWRTVALLFISATVFVLYLMLILVLSMH
jgi:hypothetical protein